MKVLVNDYPGHPFQIQLSRELSKRNYNLLHTYCSSVQSPRGDLKNHETDSRNINIVGISLSSQITKDSFIKRRLLEKEYGEKVCRLIKSFKPNCVIISNTPIDAQSLIWNLCKELDIPIIYWLQDIQSIAINKILSKKLPFLGGIISSYYKRKEIKQLRESKYVITISENFNSILYEWNINKDKILFIPNWAPIDTLPRMNLNNGWIKKNNLFGKRIILYSGTLGFKHNPKLLEKLSIAIKDRQDTILLVISEGLGAKYLDNTKTKHRLSNLIILPFQPFDDLPNIMGGATVLIAILENDAGIFSVPSKILTYLCSGKPIVLSSPSNNLSTEIIKKSNAGFVSEPTDENDFINNVIQLLDNDLLCSQFGENGRIYAESFFDIEKIINKFIKILNLI
jgi:glycosyltransferase involved in cell wall biosynthesis